MYLWGFLSYTVLLSCGDMVGVQILLMIITASFSLTDEDCVIQTKAPEQADQRTLSGDCSVDFDCI